MTDTRKAGTNERDLPGQSASAQAVAWMARQLRWEETLAALRTGRASATTREAA